MTTSYQFPVEQCDVPTPKRAQLEQFRALRSKWVGMLRGDHQNTISSQLSALLWHDTLFRTLNEARRLNPNNPVNGPMWELMFRGYISLMVTGIRRLTDLANNASSLRILIKQMRTNNHLLTRENMICYDGWPFDPTSAKHASDESIVSGSDGAYYRISTAGSTAWMHSDLANKAFDRTCGNPTNRKRSDTVSPFVFDRLDTALSTPEIKRVRTFVDKVVAHSEHKVDMNDPELKPTLSDIEHSLQTLVQVRQLISTGILYDTDYAGVPVPQFNVLEALDKGFLAPELFPDLHKFWHERSKACDEWTSPASGYDKLIFQPN